MLLVRLGKWLLLGLICKIIFLNQLHADEESPQYGYCYPIKTPPAVQFFRAGQIERPSPISASFSIGAGFLYFRGRSGNLTPIPSSRFTNYAGADFGKIGSLNYNVTPVYEISLSSRIFDWLRASLALQTQSYVFVSSDPNSATAVNASNNPTWALFSSDLALYSMSLRVTYDCPYPLLIKTFAIQPYFGMNAGVGWQSWTNVTLYEQVTSGGTTTSSSIGLRSKYVANAIWGGDAGLLFRPASPDAIIAIKVGCRFTDWGQTRSIGIQQQQASKVAPFKPIRIQKVYSFAPYVGVRWFF